MSKDVSPDLVLNNREDIPEAENTQTEPERLLTVSEFANAIGKTERQVYRYIKTGRLASRSPEETGQSGVRIPATQLAQFIEVNLPGMKSRNGNNDGQDISAEEAQFFAPLSSAEKEEAKLQNKAGKSANDAGTAPSQSHRIFIEMGEGHTVTDNGFIKEDTGPTVPLDRHEAAIFRLGRLQNQLEQIQLQLSDGRDHEEEMQRKLEEAQKAMEAQERELIKAQAQAELAQEARQKAEIKANSLMLQLEEAKRLAELPWWKRIFN